jgi:hypothetical protein
MTTYRGTPSLPRPDTFPTVPRGNRDGSTPPLKPPQPLPPSAGSVGRDLPVNVPPVPTRQK